MPARRSPQYLENIVLTAIVGAARPVSAHGLVALLAQRGERLAASQAYRTLERLMANGDVVRIETINAYRPARSGEVERPALICRSCRKSSTIDHSNFGERLMLLSSSRGFRTFRFVLEIVGTCPDCQIGSDMQRVLRRAC